MNPNLKGDIEKLESIQHKVTSLVPELKREEYGDRLKKLRLTTPETRKEKKGGFNRVLQSREWSRPH